MSGEAEPVFPGTDDIAIHHHQVRADHFPIAQNGARLIAAHHLGAGPDFDSASSGQIRQNGSDAGHSPFHIPGAKPGFHIGNNVEGGRGPVGAAAVVSGKAFEELGQMRILEKGVDLLAQGLEGGNLGKMPQLKPVVRCEGFPQLLGRPGQKSFAGKLVNSGSILEEVGHILLPEKGLVFIHALAIRPEVAANRIDLLKFEIILPPQPQIGKKFVEHIGHGQQRRPHVPAEPIRPKLAQFAADRFVLLQQSHLSPGLPQAQSGSQPRKAPTDDRGPNGLKRSFAVHRAKNSRCVPAKGNTRRKYF